MAVVQVIILVCNYRISFYQWRDAVAASLFFNTVNANITVWPETNVNIRIEGDYGKWFASWRVCYCAEEDKDVNVSFGFEFNLNVFALRRDREKGTKTSCWEHVEKNYYLIFKMFWNIFEYARIFYHTPLAPFTNAVGPTLQHHVFIRIFPYTSITAHSQDFLFTLSPNYTRWRIEKNQWITINKKKEMPMKK